MSRIMSNNGGATMEAGQAAGPKGANQGLKKGPWTAAEDAILIEYVKRHGEGNWNSVQKNSGLMRCGKSCRLRWANHLRPNLRKGSFTPEEERIIIELHAKLGNKWARMASQLPGRTDNEIKNYWNTRMKRRQRAGLPIYPQEFQEEAAAFQFHQQQQQQQQDHHQHQRNPADHHHSSSHHHNSLSSLLSGSSSSRKGAPYNPSSLSLLSPINFSSSLEHNPLQNHHLHPSFYPSNSTTQFKFLGDKNTTDHVGNLAPLSISPLSPYSGSHSSTNLFNQSHACPAQAMPGTSPPPPPPLLHQEASDQDYENMSFTSLIMGAQVDPIAAFNIPGLRPELPSDQPPPPLPTTPLSCSGGGVCAMQSSSNYNNGGHETCSEAAAPPEAEGNDNNNSGLLDALLQEARTMSRKGNSRGGSPVVSAPDKGKGVVEEPVGEEEEEEEEGREESSKRVKLSLANGSEANHQGADDMSSSQSSIGMKPNEEAVEEMHSMDDDLLSLLTNFPSSAPLPEWYRRSRNGADDHHGTSSTGNGGDTTGIDGGQQQEASGTQDNPDDAAPDLNWALGSGTGWNNMPGIC